MVEGEMEKTGRKSRYEGEADGQHSQFGVPDLVKDEALLVELGKLELLGGFRGGLPFGSGLGHGG